MRSGPARLFGHLPKTGQSYRARLRQYDQGLCREQGTGCRPVAIAAAELENTQVTLKYLVTSLA